MMASVTRQARHLVASLADSLSWAARNGQPLNEHLAKLILDAVLINKREA